MPEVASLKPEAQALIDKAFEHQRALNGITDELARMSIQVEFGTVGWSQLGAPNAERLRLGFKLIISPTRSEQVR